MALTAFDELQEAIDAAETGGFGEVWVAADTYDEVRSADVDGSLVMKSGVNIYGGFNGNELNRNLRDWEANVTTIDGTNGLGTGVQAYHVVKGADNVALDGFVISGGYADGTTNAERSGGGMYNENVSPRVTNCTFRDNIAQYYGGGMYNVSATPTVTNCLFISNAALAWHGGGIYNDNASPALITNCNFLYNSSWNFNGGGIANDGAATTVSNCIFMGNYAYFGSGVANLGSAPTVTKCIFVDNNAEIGGGAVYNDNSSPVIANCLFTGNSAPNYAGALYNGSNTLPTLVSNCTFSGNSSDSSGAAIAINNGNLTLTNSILWGNQAGSSSEIYVYLSSPTVRYSCVEGGYDDSVNAATMVAGPPDFTGVLASGTGSAVSAYDSTTGRSTLTHIAGFTPGTLGGRILWVDIDNDSTVDTPFPIIRNGADSITVYGNVSATTTFVYEAWDYSLAPASPCIDTGMDSNAAETGGVFDDLVGNARPQDGDSLGSGSTGDGSDYDIGAYEY